MVKNNERANTRGTIETTRASVTGTSEATDEATIAGTILPKTTGCA
jgi:hypothetical protein